MRGTRVLKLVPVVHQRFIPARAGNTSSRPGRDARPTVHPRTCGEHSSRSAARRSCTGSSPHVRGTRHDYRHEPRDRRFIPARAGNTRTPPGTSTASSVHPRTCGEHAFRPPGLVARIGSSPHVRGTPVLADLLEPVPRFIPARAGNTSSASSPRTRLSVHPRTCGEHGLNMPSIAPATGSSPHVRGTRPDGGGRTLAARFIPARAGNTGGFAPPRLPMTVHPRTCGEHGTMRLSVAVCIGSSPHVRGTPYLGGAVDSGPRFIPARAGNTRKPRFRFALTSVHPRTCGEHFTVTGLTAGTTGSSPHVRGTLVDPRPQPLGFRFIPARAGNTLPVKH